MIKKILIIMIIAFPTVVFATNSLKQNFVGVNGKIKNELEEMAKNAAEESPPANNPDDIQAFKEQTIHEIKNLLAAQGYFKPIISSTIKKNGSRWQIDYLIQPGNLLHITCLNLKIEGEGKYDPAFQDLINDFPIHKGDVVSSKEYQEAKTALVDLAAQRGYFSAKLIKNTILINLEKNSAEVIIHFNTGPRYYFGDVIFLPSPYSCRFLNRFIPFKRNSPFLNKKVVKLQENLGSSNFFQQVTVTPKPELARGLAVPIEVELVPRKKLQYCFGVGFGTDTGLRGMAGVQFRRINSEGHHGDAVIQASEKLNHFEANYIIPGRNPVRDFYKLSVAAEEQHLNTSGKSRYEKVEASQIRTFCGWQQTLSLSLRDERSEPTDGRPVVNSTMLLPNLNWTKIKSDDPLSPNYGYLINFNLRGASKAFISNTDFIQALLQTKALLPLSSCTRLIAKGQLGYTAISNLNRLPITLQFYTGGAQTVRGYQFQEIGPGRSLLVLSLELQQRIKGNLYGAVFIDAGSASNGFVDDLRSGVGIGLVWRSPIGAIEVTLTQAIDKPGHPRLLQFSMGPEL